MTDMTLLKDVIRKSGLKKTYLAEALGLSYQGFLNKLNGANEFTASEIGILKKVLNLSDKDVVRIFLRVE